MSPKSRVIRSFKVQSLVKVAFFCFFFLEIWNQIEGSQMFSPIH